MESILDFLANNYLYFMLGGGILLIALIGFLVSDKKKQVKEETVEFNSIPSNVENNVSSVDNSTVEEQNVVQPVTTEQQNAKPVAEEPNLDFAQSTLESTVNEVVNKEEPVLSFETEVPTEEPKFQTFEHAENETNEILKGGSIGEPIAAPEPEMVEMQIETPVIETPIFEEPVITEQTVESSVASTDVIPEPFNSETIPSVEPVVNEEPIFEEIVEPANINAEVLPENNVQEMPADEEIIEPIFEEENVLSEVPVETVSELEAPKIEELETFE